MKQKTYPPAGEKEKSCSYTKAKEKRENAPMKEESPWPATQAKYMRE